MIAILKLMRRHMLGGSIKFWVEVFFSKNWKRAFYFINKFVDLNEKLDFVEKNDSFVDKMQIFMYFGEF